MGCYILADIKENKLNTYICCKHNHYLETYNINDAAEFNSILAANNILHNNVKNVEGKYKPVEKSTIEVPKSIDFPKVASLEEENLQVPKGDYYNKTLDNPSYTINRNLPHNLEYFINLVKDMADCLEVISGSIEENKNIVKEKDKATLDIIHFMEFVDLNASDGFKTYKKLQEVRQERRDSKDIIALVSILSDFGITSEKLTSLSQALTDNFYERAYTPREVDLFAEFCKGD